MVALLRREGPAIPEAVFSSGKACQESRQASPLARSQGLGLWVLAGLGRAKCLFL